MIHTIVNQHTADLANCESEPIHVPGSIQPFGFLLGLRPDSLTIEYCSGNCDQYLAYTPEDLLGKSLQFLLPQDEIEHLKQYFFTEEAALNYPFVIEVNKQLFNLHIHRKVDLLLLEFEPKPAEEVTLVKLYGQMKRFANGTEQARSLKQLSQMVAEETRLITGFDRVMIYQFDPEYNGVVIAESKRADLEPFLNLHYPHTDIPPQARQLYLQNLVRLIADVHYVPVPIFTQNNVADHKSVDLSHAVLRSVSPIHVEYLKNMGVGASFSVSLVHEGRLWGLIACHHDQPKVLPHHLRLSAQLQGHFLTSQIGVQEAKDAFERTQIADIHLQQLQKILRSSKNFVEEIYTSIHLLQLVKAQGVLIVHDGTFYQNGIVPTDEIELRQLVHWLADHTNAGYLHTDSLMDLYPKAKALGDIAAGILYHSLGASELNCIIWFRPEVAQTIEWAGNPEKAMLEKAQGIRLSPRKSFEAWTQEVRHKSEAWNPVELGIAASFAYALQKQIHLDAVAREEVRYRRLNEQLIEANEELSRINWISTHDLKEPLRKIQMFGSRILESEKDTLSDMVASSVTRMRVSASRMQTLIDDIMLYSKMSIKDEAATDVSLNSVIDEVILEVEEELKANEVRVNVAALPTLRGIHMQLTQLFRNLLSNALKFAKKDVPLVWEITCDKVEKPLLKELANSAASQFYCIQVKDNGIGFESIYANRIFDVFQRLHTSSEYAGTGIGLAICRRIMLNHEGGITADSHPNEGAVFNLYFPV